MTLISKACFKCHILAHRLEKNIFCHYKIIVISHSDYLNSVISKVGGALGAVESEKEEWAVRV